MILLQNGYLEYIQRSVTLVQQTRDPTTPSDTFSASTLLNPSSPIFPGQLGHSEPRREHSCHAKEVP